MCLSNVREQRSPETFGQALNYSFDNAEFLREKVKHKKHLLSAQKLRAMAGCPAALKALAANPDLKKLPVFPETPDVQGSATSDDWLSTSTALLRTALGSVNHRLEACWNSAAYE